MLALWGVAEFVTSREDHEWIASLVNQVEEESRPFRVVDASTHGFDRTDTPADAIRQSNDPSLPVEFNPAVVETLTTG